jgi:hypothetical protein
LERTVNVKEPAVFVVRRILSLALMLTALALALAGGPAADVAHADRCQPEELVLGPGNSPLGPDSGDPRCPVMQAVVYDQLVCDDTTLMKCLGSLDARATLDYQRAQRLAGVEGCVRGVLTAIDYYLQDTPQPQECDPV